MKPLLAVNCGSSSLKFHVFEPGPESNAEPRMVCAAEAEQIGKPGGAFHFRDCLDDSRTRSEQLVFPDHGTALNHGLDLLESLGIAPNYSGVAHRFVHGGPVLTRHQRLTPQVLEQIKAAIPFAQLHLPAAIAAAEAVTRRYGALPQFACFDTAFHQTLPDVARLFPLPQEYADLGIRRYGFHGLSLESILDQLDPIPERLIVAHLGNGASITAIRAGTSVATSMGLTPTGGIMMGTRSGDLDPGVLLFLLRRGVGPDELESALEHKAGLLGVSGRSSDVRELLAARATDARADLALRMFCDRAAREIAAMAASLGGVDLLVFTGGIGEHAASIRAEIIKPLEFMQLPEVRILPAQEDLRMVRIAIKLLASG